MMMDSGRAGLFMPGIGACFAVANRERIGRRGRRHRHLRCHDPGEKQLQHENVGRRYGNPRPQTAFRPQKHRHGQTPWAS